MLTKTYRATTLNRLRYAPFAIATLAIATALLVVSTGAAQGPHELAALVPHEPAGPVPNQRCKECHSRPLIAMLPIRFSDGEEVSPLVDLVALSQSVHAKLACVECHRESHPEFAGVIGPREFPTRRQYVQQIEQACRDCHESVFKTVDGQAIVHGTYQGDDAPLCVDCHAGHATTSVTATFAAAGVMEGTKSWGAMFATKGIEYLLVIGYAAVFIPLAILLCRIAQQTDLLPHFQTAPARRRGSWFRLPEGFSLHRGHTWALPETGNVFKVGIDDFARRLIGQPAALMLPAPGSKLDQGERGWQVRVNGTILDLLSPVTGEVLEVNQQAVNSPSAVAEDPYGAGWLMKVRTSQPQAALANLLSDRLAGAWYDEVEEELGSLMHGELGTVLQDGGIPVQGFARELAGDDWPELAARFLLSTCSKAP